ncbi:MAG TPA: ABC transporter permease [Steroidobacteraceae bacterium]|jgi:ABC-2 type transport system permease protein|nr:ABC transporter permease [Steroidobacteraceae bacterium]
MLDSLLRILALTRKELLAVLKDKRSRLSLLIPPVVQALIFGYAATYDLNHVTYAALDQDHSAASRQLLAGLDGSGVFERVADLQRAGDIATYIDARRALLVVQIDQNFERQLLSGRGADLQVVADGRNSNTAGTAIGYVGSIVEQFNAAWGGDHGWAPAPVQMVSRAWYNPNLETRWFMIPGMIGTLTLIQTMMLTAMSVAREREQGTFDQLLVTPFRPYEIMAGKALPSMLVGTIQATGVLLVAQLWFRIPFAGSYLTLYAGLMLFLLAAVGIGLLLSAVAATMQQAMLYSMLLIMPFSLLSGLTTPLSSMPDWLQYLTAINPLRYAIDITRRVYLEGTGFNLLLPDLWPLCLLAALTLSGASWMFSHRMQ